MDRNETYRSRLLADNGESKDYICILSNKLPCIARIEKGTPSMYGSRLNRLHSHSALWEELSSLDEAFPIVAVGFSAYLLFCRTEVGGEVGHHCFDDWNYISKEQCFQLYIDKLFNAHRGANKELYSIKVANGKADEFKANFLSSLSKEEKVYLKRSMALGYINRDIINEAKEFLSSLTESEEKQADEAPTYLFSANGVPLGNILQLLKDAQQVDMSLTIEDFSSCIRNGRLSCIKLATYKKMLIRGLCARLGDEWRNTTMREEQITMEAIKKQNTSRDKYKAFESELYKLL